jgi:hypothetical protein
MHALGDRAARVLRSPPSRRANREAGADRPGAAAWEQLSAAERDLLIAPIRERWNAEPAARTRMLEHAKRWQTMTPEQRKAAHDGMRRWSHLNPEQREHARALYERMRGMDPDARRALRDQWRTMTPEQRDAWLEQHPPRSRRRSARADPQACARSGHTERASSSSFQSNASAPSFNNRRRSCRRCARTSRWRAARPCWRGSAGRRWTTPLLSIVSPGCVSSQLPPVSAARSTITLPGFMPATIAAVTIFGAGRPGTAAVQTTTSMS